MRRQRQKLHLVLFFMLGWLMCTILFVFVGYCITGAIPVINIEMSYFERLLMVVSSPLDGYFNQYTPIGMITGFILCEIIFFLVVYSMNQKSKKKRVDDDNAEECSEFFYKKSNVGSTLDEEELDDNLDKVHQKVENVENVSEKGMIQEEANVDIGFQEQTFLELFSNGYSLQQITEMMELTKYIKNLDVSLLKKMFKPTMSPEDIRTYIESFYG